MFSQKLSERPFILNDLYIKQKSIMTRSHLFVEQKIYT